MDTHDLFRFDAVLAICWHLGYWWRHLVLVSWLLDFMVEHQDYAVILSEGFAMMPNNSPEPPPIGALRSAFAVDRSGGAAQLLSLGHFAYAQSGTLLFCRHDSGDTCGDGGYSAPSIFSKAEIVFSVWSCNHSVSKRSMFCGDLSSRKVLRRRMARAYSRGVEKRYRQIKQFTIGNV